MVGAQTGFDMAKGNAELARHQSCRIGSRRVTLDNQNIRRHMSHGGANAGSQFGNAREERHPIDLRGTYVATDSQEMKHSIDSGQMLAAIHHDRGAVRAFVENMIDAGELKALRSCSQDEEHFAGRG